MANSSEIKEKIQKDLEMNTPINTPPPNLYLDLSRACPHAVNQPVINHNQVTEISLAEIQLKGVRNLCELKTMANIYDSSLLNLDTKELLVDYLVHSGGIIPGMKTSKKHQDMLQWISENIDTDILIDIFQKCVKDVTLGSQTLHSMRIEDALQYNLSQVNTEFLECVEDKIKPFLNNTLPWYNPTPTPTHNSSNNNFQYIAMILTICYIISIVTIISLFIMSK